MKTRPLILTTSHFRGINRARRSHIGVLLLAAIAGTINVSATVRYVDLTCASPTPPYTGWTTAATNIQDAVDAAGDGDEIVVTNGVYQTGGRVVYGAMTNRVVVDKAVLLRSLNGPTVTVIQGYQVPVLRIGNEAIRCVYLTNGAVLSGFTLTNGATRGVGGYREWNGGGVWCESPDAVVTNCTLTGNWAWVAGGGAHGGTLNNCTLAGNGAHAYLFSSGGGAYGSTLNDCTLMDNSAYEGGGGSAASTLNHCTLTGNVSSDYGGGAYDCTLNYCTLAGTNDARYGGGAADCRLNHCTLTGNGAFWGGGAHRSTLNNCTLTGNSADDEGGGAIDCTLNNCTLTGNSARRGGGTYRGTLTNCVLTGNRAGVGGGGAVAGSLNNCTLTGNSTTFRLGDGGGVLHCALTNCIVFYNTAATNANYSDSTFNYSCTTPLPPGPGNIISDPMFVNVAAGDLHLLPASPCVNAGLNQDWMTSSTDLDGNPRISGGVVDMGAFELTLGPTVLVERLMAQVESSWPRSRPLLATLSSALRSIERGNSVAAVNQLQAFQNKVRAQVSRSDPALAASFIGVAQEVIDELRGEAHGG